MGLLRSETMGYYNLVMQSDMAWKIMNELGKLSAIQFVDLNSDQTVFNRRYAGYIRRCEEAERRIRFLKQEQERFNISVFSAEDPMRVLDQIDDDLDTTNTPAQTRFEELESELEQFENNVLNQLKHYEHLLTGSNVLLERKIVMNKAREAFGQEAGVSMFSRLAGIIDKEDINRFKRMVFRVTRGNALTMFYDVEERIKDPKTDEVVEKSVFFILYRGDLEGVLSGKLGRICDTLGIRRYAVPMDQRQLEEDFYKNEEDIKGNEEIMNKTKENIQSALQKLASGKSHDSLCSLIEEYSLFVLKEKTIYHNLNTFHFKNQIFYGKCWCPKTEEGRIIDMLNEFARQPGFSSAQLREVQGGFPPDQLAPTYFRLNAFTSSFQEIVDTYGVPNYKEANPALFTCVTFPFLFGVMFGDVGHGLIMLLFACYLCYFKETIEKSDSLFKPMLSARYLLLMMGLCGTYCGLIYNDFLGIPFNFFGSRWEYREQYDQYVSTSTYPFGMDPVWYKSSNELVFFNSFKMKVSVIFGVIQMLAGNLLKGSNSLHFRSSLDFFFEFIPQIVFMGCIFGYMIIMIFIKWTTDWNYNWGDNAPNLITVLMNMFLKLGSLDDSNNLFWTKESQEHLQTILLVIGLICVPLMLFPKPLIKKYMHARQGQDYVQGANVDYQQFENDEENVHKQEEEFSFGEEFIHQMIETIEYVLGAVSNTASYLRLWALSLAHGQLSKVFFNKCMASTIETGNPVLVVIGFFVFANVTLGVLMCMDALECFLHALRLHWVEFQNKFYKGQGVRFAPFSFEKVANESKL